jgi:hypothetical protein
LRLRQTGLSDVDALSPDHVVQPGAKLADVWIRRVERLALARIHGDKDPIVRFERQSEMTPIRDVLAPAFDGDRILGELLFNCERAFLVPFHVPRVAQFLPSGLYRCDFRGPFATNPFDLEPTSANHAILALQPAPQCPAFRLQLPRWSESS